MNPTPPNRKKLIAIGAAVVVIIGAAIAILILPQGANRSGTGNTPSPSPTPPPADSAKASTRPNYTNFDDFLTFGVTPDQVSDLKYAFFKYIKSSKKTVKNVAVSQIHPIPRNPDVFNPIFSLNFTVKFDSGTTYSAKVETSQTTWARLYLYNSGGTTLIYDSGPIDLYNGIGNTD
jgi:hypothetical protein